MHVLTVISHPNPASFTHAIAEAFIAGAQEAGHTAEIADLHAEDFDPRWTTPDFDQFEGGASPPDVLAEQARIDRCDAVCLVFPLYWYGMPAMMKGWADRVWSYGWAYDQIVDPNLSMQRARTGVFLVPAGGNPNNWTPYGFTEAMNTLWSQGLMGYFGLSDKRIHLLNGSEGSEARRAGLLDRARVSGRTIGIKRDDLDVDIDALPLPEWTRER